jgi:uncharacterized membrane protein YfcA
VATAVAFAAISLLAYAVKAATGFGPAIVVVALGSLLVGPVNAVILAAFLDVLGGLGVMYTDRHQRGRVKWAGMAVIMCVGAIAGGLLLPVVPTALLRRIVGLGVLGFGLWMLLAPVLRRTRWTLGTPLRSDAASSSASRSTSRGPPGAGSNTASRSPASRRRARASDYGVAAVAGVSGGLIGLGGPPLIIYLNSRVAKVEFRALLVPILLAAAVTRMATYGLTGQVHAQVLVLAAVSLPALPLGLVLGDRLFRRWSETAFQMAVAVLIATAGARLLF